MSRKLVVVLVVIVFLLPFVSWYYLNSGLEWRKKAQSYMNGTMPFPEGTWNDRNGTKLDSTAFAFHVSLMTFISCEDANNSMQFIEPFYDQFKESGKANFILLDSCSSPVSRLDETGKKNWFHISCLDSISPCQTLKQHWPSNKPYALVDRHGVIRSYYAVGTEEEKKQLLEHMALLLPRERQEEVELKRGTKK